MYVDGTLEKRTDYLGNMIYKNDTLRYELLEQEMVAEEAGYAYIYLSNDDDEPVEVYFDDFTVAHVESGVVQVNNYYPFGLRHATSWTRPEAVPNAFLYNAGSELNGKTKNYETFFRQYDPALGRFTGVDPLAGIAPSLTPYHYGRNNPVFYNDPLGATSEAYWWEGGSTGGGSRISVMDVLSARTDGSDSRWTRNLSGFGGLWYGRGAGYAERSGAYGPSYQEINARKHLEALGYVQKSDHWGYYSYGQYTLPDGSLSEPTNNGFTPLFEDGSAQNGGCCPDNDWFGRLGSLFEKNYNGGVEYDGDAWYGTNFIGPGPTENPYKLIDKNNPGQYLKPKDMVDAAAQRHDYLLGADGVTGALFNTNVTFADQILANEAYNAFTGYFRGDIDPITGNAISPRTRDVAFDILVSFGLIGSAKFKFP